MIMTQNVSIIEDLQNRFGPTALIQQQTKNNFPTLWIQKENLQKILRYLKEQVTGPYRMLYDLTALDERIRTNRRDQPLSDFTVTYRLVSFERNEDVQLKVALSEDDLSLPSIVSVWPNANWYEREAFDLFGIDFEGHPHLRRLLMPPGWKGHPLRKDYPARATDMEPYLLPDDRMEQEQAELKFRPEDWGMTRHRGETDFLYLNFGPHHLGTHGPLRLILELDGEEIVDVVPDIGYHHRGQEKMGERQTWHTYIPYTDRVDYLSGVLNNFPYVLAVEKLAGITVPDRAKVIRIMMAELFRIVSHLVWYGTYAQDIGQMTPTFLTFNDRERAFEITEAVCGFRMHPAWFRIGGVAQDLPRGWDRMMKDFLKYLPPRLDEYDRMVLNNAIFKARTIGIGKYTVDEAIEWGVTGPGLRACGLGWDVRKKRPYSGYDQFDFEIPVAQNGDCYDRSVIHVEEMRQSLRIIDQCIRNMPEGKYKADHPLATPPIKDRTMHDIETLIDHFLNVSWGPVIPSGEASFGIESSKGYYTYSLISDGNIHPYRARIRTPSFAHMQMLPKLSRGRMVSDLISILGAMDFVVSDIDR